MIVVDTNVIAHFYLPGEFTDLAVRARKKDSEWLAPFVWRFEFQNILAGEMRRGHMIHEVALETIAAAEKLFIEREYFPNPSGVIQCIRESKCSAYDCSFAALARQLNIRLITQDKLLLQEFPSFALSLKDFADKA